MWTTDFRIETTESATHSEIQVSGELDSATCTTLFEQFERVAARAAGSELVLDLSRVSFIDSAGIRTLVLLRRVALELAVSLSMRPPPEPVIGLLELTGIAERLALAPAAEDAGADHALLELCDLHLPAEPTAPARARAHIRRVAAERFSRSALDAVTLLTSELVTNAVIHPTRVDRGGIALRVTAYADMVRVEVSDPGEGFDPAATRQPRETGGRGLILVAALATRWGTRRSDPPRRFTVWFELDTAAQTPPDDSRQLGKINPSPSESHPGSDSRLGSRGRSAEPLSGESSTTCREPGSRSPTSTAPTTRCGGSSRRCAERASHTSRPVLPCAKRFTTPWRRPWTPRPKLRSVGSCGGSTRRSPKPTGGRFAGRR